MKFIVTMLVVGSLIIVNKADMSTEVNISKSMEDEIKIELSMTDKILIGARKDIANKPIYRSKYYSGGYPPKNEGVCTDVIWRALDEIDYDLKNKIDKDIEENIDKYSRVNGNQDKNIDFRRVPNLIVYFSRNEEELSLDIEDFKPGDIVTFTGGIDHIAIISDKKNKEGVPYLIHNDGPYTEEEDMLKTWDEFSKMTHRFRIK